MEIATNISPDIINAATMLLKPYIAGLTHETLLAAIKMAGADGPDTTTDRLLTVPQVSEYLSVSVPTVNRFLKRGTLTYVKIGTSVRVRTSEVERYITDHTQTQCN